ncbi:hypothetical protein AGMMS50262_22430 [Bacteroidia bacterium]|nr:hypothetical protein AGMMS50262_22430 [Bacteroidia bacterium]
MLNNQYLSDFAPFLSWSHFCKIMQIKDEQARLFYAKDAVERQSLVPFNVFKDPYLLDVFDLKDNFLESDLENAILIERRIFFGY